MDVLKTGLVNIAVENYEAKWYIPWTELNSLLSLENVKAAIAESGLEPYEQEEALQSVLHGGKKVFATLVQTDDVSSIMKFIAHDHLQNQPLDAKLPFTRPALISILGQSQGAWFYRTQWTVSAPFFRGDLSHRNFDRAVILPFVGNKKIGNGAFGAVYETVLDSKHQADVTSANLPKVFWFTVWV